MLSRICLENHLNFSHKLRPVVSFCLFEGSFSNRKYSTHDTNNKKGSLSKHVRSSPQASFGKKAKEATKTTYYTAVVIAGLGAFGLMMYAIFRELLSSFSPQSVYSAAVERISSEPRITDLFGGNIKCFGETSRRGRRQHINHMLYEVDGKRGMRIKFYLQGQYRSGSVNLDARVCPSGWQFRYLFVQSDSYPYEVVVVEDNRGTMDVGGSDVTKAGLDLSDLTKLEES